LGSSRSRKFLDQLSNCQWTHKENHRWTVTACRAQRTECTATMVGRYMQRDTIIGRTARVHKHRTTTPRLCGTNPYRPHSRRQCSANGTQSEALQRFTASLLSYAPLSAKRGRHCDVQAEFNSRLTTLLQQLLS
jgi:hypothetical protein